MIFWLFVALMIDRAQLVLCASSYGNPFCGVGTVDGVNQRATSAPMAYRVLVPYVIGFIERLIPSLAQHRIMVYEMLKVMMMAVMLWVIEQNFSLSVALLLAALLPVTFMYDYWDWIIELGSLALAMSGHLIGATIGGVLTGLSRETAPLIALTYLLKTQDIGGAMLITLVIAATLVAVRLWVGKRALYCDRFMIKRNIAEIRHMFKCNPFFTSNIAMSLIVTMLTIAIVIGGNAGPTWPIPLICLAAGWTMAIATETRVFAACLLWIAIGVLR